MSIGFSGATVEKFFESTEKALEKAAEVHNRSPLKNMQPKRATLPSFPEPRNQKMPFSPGDANPALDRYSTGVGRSSNLVVDNSTYETASRQLTKADDQAGEEIYKMACTIEELCGSMYIVIEHLGRFQLLTG